MGCASLTAGSRTFRVCISCKAEGDKLTWRNAGDRRSFPPSSPGRWDLWLLRDVNIPRPVWEGEHPRFTFVAQYCWCFFPRVAALPKVRWFLCISPPQGHIWSCCWNMALVPTVHIRKDFLKMSHSLQFPSLMSLKYKGGEKSDVTSIPSISYSSCSDLRVSRMKSCCSFSLQ